MTLSVAFLEVYNEAVRDLLVTNAGKDSAALDVSGIPAGQLAGRATYLTHITYMLQPVSDVDGRAASSASPGGSMLNSIGTRSPL